jgi:putative ABC transport system permease protein
MKILKSLTLKDLKLNKKRTIGTIVGIILSCALITVIGLFFESMRYTLFKNEADSNGYWHVQLHDISSSEIAELKNNRDYSDMAVVNPLGDVITDQDGYMYSTVISMNRDTFDFLKYKLEDGVFPKNKNEIAISKSFADNFEYKIGDTVSMDVGFAVSPADVYGLVIQDGTNYTFKITGILGEYSNNVTTGYDDSDTYTVYLTLKNPNNYKQDICELLGIKKYDTRAESPKYGYNYSVHRSLLQWEVFDFGDRVMEVFVGVLTVVIGIVMVASVFAIRNSFAISISEKIKT